MAVSQLGGMLSDLESSTTKALAVGKDAKVMIEGEIRRIQAGVAADRAKTITHSILSRAAIPPRFADRRLSNYQPTCPETAKTLQVVAQQYADSFGQAIKTGRSLIFIGNVRAGKTHLAVGIAHEVMQQDYSALYYLRLEFVTKQLAFQMGFVPAGLSAAQQGAAARGM